jgi:hypothetical protein
MPSPEERDRLCDAKNFCSPPPDPTIEKLMEDATKRLIDELSKELSDNHKKLTNACSEQCTCTALYTSATCAIHGPAFRRHIENRK